MHLYTWSWFFLFCYVLIMIIIGIIGNNRVTNSDDFATARNSYGPLLLALAFASTAASGATFLGLPGLTYTYGLSTLWIAFLYPIGIYIGILISQRSIAKFGNSSGARSIPEYLGERYQSEFLRVSAAIFSLILLFYLAGQLVAGLVMFEMMLGIPKSWALIITTLVLLAYITFGGAHADILTDGAQGLLMIFLAIMIAILFILGVGSDGLPNLVLKLKNDDPQLVSSFYSGSPITASIWSYISLVVAHIPLGLLPHIGNKLWALKNESSRSRFLILAFSFGMILPAITLGGALARGIFGDDLLDSSLGANAALPRLFIDIFPTWVAALLGVGILSAVMSTADGLVISTSQVFANDIYRKTIAPRIHQNLNQDRLDKNVLIISRIVTALTLVGASVLAWFTIGMNVVLLTWIGIGGFTAALMGPLVLGCIWRGVTPAGAIFGFWFGAILFILIHTQILSSLIYLGDWFKFYSDSPYSAATISGLLAVIATIFISLFTKTLPRHHLDKAF